MSADHLPPVTHDGTAIDFDSEPPAPTLWELEPELCRLLVVGAVCWLVLIYLVVAPYFGWWAP